MWSSRLRKFDESSEIGDSNYWRCASYRKYQIDNKPKVRDEIEVEEIEGRTGGYPLILSLSAHTMVIRICCAWG